MGYTRKALQHYGGLGADASDWSGDQYKQMAMGVATNAGWPSKIVIVGITKNGASSKVQVASSADDAATIYDQFGPNFAYTAWFDPSVTDDVYQEARGGVVVYTSFFDKLKSPWVIGAGAVLLAWVVFWDKGKKGRRGRSRRRR